MISLKEIILSLDKNYDKGIIASVALILSGVSLFFSWKSSRTAGKNYNFNILDKTFPVYESFINAFGNFVKPERYLCLNGHTTPELSLKNKLLIRKCAIIFSTPNNAEKILDYASKYIRNSNMSARRFKYFHGGDEKFIHNRWLLEIEIKDLKQKIYDHRDDSVYNKLFKESDIVRHDDLQKKQRHFGEMTEEYYSHFNYISRSNIFLDKFNIEFKKLNSLIDCKIKYRGSIVNYIFYVTKCILIYYIAIATHFLKRLKGNYYS